MKKFVVVLVVILIIGIAGFIGYYLRRNPIKPLPVIIENITKDKIDLALKKSLENFESWKNPQVDQKYTLYDLDGAPSAYLYTIKDNYGKSGYVVISANTRHSPFIEVSKSTESPSAVLSMLTVNLTNNTVHSYKNVKSEMIYIGGTEYYAKLTFREGDDVAVRYYSLQSSDPVEIDQKELKQLFSDYLKNQEQGAVEAWDNLK